jgi:broad specificity phosphatase PhoE
MADKSKMKCNRPVPSDRPGQKMMVKACSGGEEKLLHFGAKGYQDYTDHHDQMRKTNYLNRHGNEDWNDYMTAGSLAFHILWNKPTITESIKDYARRLSEKITDFQEDSVIIGMSLGGIISVELSKILPMKKVFLIKA